MQVKSEEMVLLIQSFALSASMIVTLCDYTFRSEFTQTHQLVISCQLEKYSSIMFHFLFGSQTLLRTTDSWYYESLFCT
jgi:hypothetical protein